MAYQIIPDSVRDLFNYEPDTGKLWWKQSGAGRRLDRAAGTTQKDGYLAVIVKGRKLYAHRIAWFLQTGEQPQVIDHINHDRADNRASNLRNVSQKTNAANNYGRGVAFNQGKWVAYHNHRHLYAGNSIMLAHYHRYMAVTATHSPALPSPSDS